MEPLLASVVSCDRSGEVVRASRGADGDSVSVTCWAAPTGVRDDVGDVTSAFVIFACSDDIWRSRRNRRVNIAGVSNSPGDTGGRFRKFRASKTTGFSTCQNFVSISVIACKMSSHYLSLALSRLGGISFCVDGWRISPIVPSSPQ